MTYVLFVLVLAIVVLAYLGVSREVAIRKQRKAFVQRLYQITPDDKPFFAFCSLQKSQAFTTYDRLVDPGTERIEIPTPGGNKLLVNRTASILEVEYYRDERDANYGPYSIFDYLTEKVMNCTKPNLASEYNFTIWNLAKRRLFLGCGELYVQFGTKIPSCTSRVEIERLNIRCRLYCDVFEALEADIAQSIQSRTQAR